MDRQIRHETAEIQEVGSRVVQFHSQRLTIESRNANRRKIFYRAFVKSFGVPNGEKDVSVLRRCFRQQCAFPRRHKIIGGDWVSVSPFCFRPEMKCINPAIGRDLPGLGNPGVRTAETIEMEQALEESVRHASIKMG